ncbi:MAG: tRNA (cytidine(56)-2'-O)-methyltransferase, partial [Candidatus Diapherotrites archaeon]
MQWIEVVRIGHRKERDIRVTTHCALAARALGCKKITICGEDASRIRKTVEAVNQNWGKGIEVETQKGFRSALKKAKKEKKVLVHLTMYGEPFESKLNLLKKAKKLCIIVGAEKVPREVYEISDYNLSVTNQPHSEIAALGVLL